MVVTTAPPALPVKDSAFGPYTIFICFVWMSQ